MKQADEKIILTLKTAKSAYFILKNEGKYFAELANGEKKECTSLLGAWDLIDKSVRGLLKEKRKKHGDNGRVLLTDEELERIYRDFGEEETKKCIEYIDEAAAINGNKNKWKNWNLVIRKCHREQWHKKSTEKSETTASYDMSEFERRAEQLPIYKKKG